MEAIKAFGQFIRWKNLLIVAFAQLLVWYLVNQKNSLQNEASMSFTSALLLIMSTVFIAAAGYIINDYFDIKIDTINRPETVLISKFYSKQKAIFLHITLSMLGLLLAIYVAQKSGNLYLSMIQLITILMLWYYSTHFKRMVLIGNVIVAFLTALSIALFLLYEPAFYKYLSQGLIINDLSFNPAHMIIGISFFAFMLNLMREVVKDMEDFKGDAEQGCVTFPIKYGLRKSGQLTSWIGVITIIALMVGVYFFAKNGEILFSILIALLILYISSVIFRIEKKSTMAHYERMSRELKVIMILGLLIFAIILW